jgi:hypothetical protein
MNWRDDVMELPKGAPALIAYTRPFRLVLRDDADQWGPSLDDINNSEYDYVKLHRLSTSIDIGLPSPLCLHIGFDGSLLLPAIQEYHQLEKAVDVFNQVLGEILIGGIYCEAVEPSDIDKGIFYPTGYFRSSGMAMSLTGQLQNMLKTKVAGPLQRIELFNPDKITAREIHIAIQLGRDICKSINNLSVMLVLQGVSSFIAHNWSESLSNFWIGIEQNISFLWKKEVILGGRTPSHNVKGRKDFLNDTSSLSTKFSCIFPP